MSNPSVVIIGGGLAGLSAGIYARLNGYPARIFEHGARPGGVSATWKRKGFTIDGGIHFYMGWRPGQFVHDLYRELGVWQPDQYREIDVYGKFVDRAMGREFTVTRDLDRLAADMKAVSPADARFIDDFVKGCRVFAGLDVYRSFAKPPDLTGVWGNLKMMASMRRGLKYWFGRHTRPVNEAARDLADPWLAEIFQNLFLPESPMVFLMMTMGLLADGNLALRLDGSAGFARALEKRFTDLGGEVIYKSTVEEILVEDQRAVGVRLAGGEEHRAGRVISAGDGHSAIFDFLGGRYVSDKVRAVYQKLPLLKPILVVSFGVARQFPDEPWTVVLKPEGTVAAGGWESRWWPVRIFNYGQALAPPGRTVVQIMADTNWRFWRDLREDKTAYKEEKARVAEQVLAGLEEFWPGIGARVEMTDVATPYTYWRYTLNREGAYQGFAITPEALRTTVARTLPGLEGFYMAGQWTVPGGGAIPSLYTGRHAVMIMCRDDGRQFKAEFA